jgi:hypothetical protein
LFLMQIWLTHTCCPKVEARDRKIESSSRKQESWNYPIWHLFSNRLFTSVPGFSWRHCMCYHDKGPLRLSLCTWSSILIMISWSMESSFQTMPIGNRRARNSRLPGEHNVTHASGWFLGTTFGLIAALRVCGSTLFKPMVPG